MIPRQPPSAWRLIAFAIRILSAAIAFVSQIILARADGRVRIRHLRLRLGAGRRSSAISHASVSTPRSSASCRSTTPARRCAEIRGLTTTVRIFALVSATAARRRRHCSGSGCFGDRSTAIIWCRSISASSRLPMIALGDMMEGTSRAHSWAVIGAEPGLYRPAAAHPRFHADCRGDRRAAHRADRDDRSPGRHLSHQPSASSSSSPGGCAGATTQGRAGSNSAPGSASPCRSS